MRALAVIIVLAFVATGCAAGPGTPGGTGPAPGAVDRSGAPPITAPRDLASRAADPCRTLLAPSQLQRLGLDAPVRFRVGPTGAPNCRWADETTSRRVSASVILNEDLFVGTYRKRIFPVFRPVEIEELPAVEIQPREDSADCTTTVGVADSQSLDLTGFVRVGADGVRRGDPCALNREVAREILSTLPPLR